MKFMKKNHFKKMQKNIIKNYKIKIGYNLMDLKTQKLYINKFFKLYKILKLN